MTYKTYTRLTTNYAELEFWQLDDDWREVRKWLVAGTDMTLSAEGFVGPDRPNGMASSGIGQHRDSDVLDRANFITALSMLEAHSEQVHTTSFGHWAVGWTESIYVPLTKACCVAVKEIHDRFINYPVLDEELWSEMEYDEAVESWEQWGYRDACRTYLDEEHVEWLEDNNLEHEEHYAIAEDIRNEGARGYTEDGCSEDALSSANAAEWMNAQITEWFKLRDWNIATSGGNQIELNL